MLQRNGAIIVGQRQFGQFLLCGFEEAKGFAMPALLVERDTEIKFKRCGLR